MAFLAASKFDTRPLPDAGGSAAPMTVNGTVVRTTLLLALSALSGVPGWFILGSRPDLIMVACLAGVVASVVFGVLAARNPIRAKVPAVGYALAQGLLVGAISRGYADAYQGVILQALGLTVTIVAVSLAMYAAGLIKVTARFRSIVLMATVAVGVYYLIAMLASLIGFQAPLIWDSGLAGIGFSLLVLGVASANLFIDYQVVTDAVRSGAPEGFEWFAAFGLCATVLWIYIEALRLMSKLRN